MIEIRRFEETDREALKRITAICFDGVCIDQNIEQLLGPVAGLDWQARKVRHVDADIAANADGIFVAADQGRVVGYISTRIDPVTRIGGIPNFAVLPELQGKGIGRQLMAAALDYLRAQGMAACRIETLAQNAIGTAFYPKVGFREVARQVHYVMPLAADSAAGVEP